MPDGHDHLLAKGFGKGLPDVHSVNVEMVFKEDFEAEHRVRSEPQDIVESGDVTERFAVENVMELFLKRRRLVEGLHQLDLKDDAVGVLRAFLGYLVVAHLGEVLTSRERSQGFDIAELKVEKLGKIRDNAKI
jgi:hypothetical protein